ncbi:MAG TPA: DUF4932 domain-containing protein [Kofleriaceae bacterium]
MRFALVLVCALACRSSEPAKQKPVSETNVARTEVRFDRRVELITILQRLVGEREYMRALGTRYVAAVDAHFKPFKDHAAVIATRELRRKSITYDAPMHLAVRLDEQFKLRAPLEDPRFTGIDIEPYLAAVRDFAAASKFDEFFTQQRSAHEQMTARLRDAIAKENAAAWFDAFFGERAGSRFITVVAPLAGTWSFGPHVGDEIYQVMGVWKVDFDELPIVDDQIIELVVHEMAHSYINPLFNAHRAALEPHGQRLFAQVGDAMTKQAYGLWHTMLDELAVRTITALYLRDRRSVDAGERAIKSEVERSFLWTPQLAELIRTRYVANRAKFPSFETFMPELIAWLATQ